MSTLLDLIPRPSLVNLSTTIIIPGDDEVDVTNGDLLLLVLRFRDALKELGVGRGQVVAMSFTNSLEFVVGFLATGVARAVSAPLNPAYSVSEYEFYLSDTKPVLFLIPRVEPGNKAAETALEAARKQGLRTAEFSIQSGRFHFRVVNQGSASSASVGPNKDKSDPEPDDVALVLHTSGTTGRPKSVPLTHKNLLRTTDNIVKTYNLTLQDRTYLVMPLFHVHGLMCGLLSSLRAGGSVVIPPKFSASTFWNDFVSTRCNWYTAVPTIHTILLNTPLPRRLPAIRFIRSCSAALPPVTFRRIEETFKAPVLEAYAMTEAAHQMTSNVIENRLPGCVGFGIGVEISIRDETGKEVPKGERGEVCARGENVTAGYWNNEKANRESFFEGHWLRTGDQGLILPGGQLQLTGRIKELINRGGEKIAPLEIDATILSVEGVGEAVCFGVEDEKYGEVVWAGVVLKGVRGADAVAEEARIKRALKGKLAPFKIPERIIITDSIPKTATGKIQRRFVKEAFVKIAKASGGPQKERAKL